MLEGTRTNLDVKWQEHWKCFMQGSLARTSLLPMEGEMSIEQSTRAPISLPEKRAMCTLLDRRLSIRAVTSTLQNTLHHLHMYFKNKQRHFDKTFHSAFLHSSVASGMYASQFGAIFEPNYSFD